MNFEKYSLFFTFKILDKITELKEQVEEYIGVIDNINDCENYDCNRLKEQLGLEIFTTLKQLIDDINSSEILQNRFMQLKNSPRMNVWKWRK